MKIHIPRPATKEELMQAVRKWRKEHNLPGIGEPRKVFNRNFNSLAPKLNQGLSSHAHR